MANFQLKTWLLASRPKTLWAAISPVIIGLAMALADGHFHWLPALATLFSAVMIQIGTNFANDYFDFHKGADTSERLGPVRATQAGLVTPNTMKKAFVAAFGLAFLAGVYLAFRGGWPIVIIGSLSIFFGVLYTATPLALAYNGLADLFVLIFFGPVAVGGTYFLQTITIDPIVIIAGVSPGLFSTAILTVNNLRDIDSDRKANKKTLPARFGRAFARVEYLVCVVLACGIPLFLHFATGTHLPALATLLVLLPAIPTIKTVFSKTDGPALNGALATTGKLLLLFSMIFAVGWNF